MRRAVSGSLAASLSMSSSAAPASVAKLSSSKLLCAKAPGAPPRADHLRPRRPVLKPQVAPRARWNGSTLPRAPTAAPARKIGQNGSVVAAAARAAAPARAVVAKKAAAAPRNGISSPPVPRNLSASSSAKNNKQNKKATHIAAHLKPKPAHQPQENAEVKPDATQRHLVRARRCASASHVHGTQMAVLVCAIEDNTTQRRANEKLAAALGAEERKNHELEDQLRRLQAERSELQHALDAAVQQRAAADRRAAALGALWRKRLDEEKQAAGASKVCPRAALGMRCWH